MDFLESLDLAQFGVAAPFIAYLIWQNHRLGKFIDQRDQDIQKWQERYISQLAEGQRDALEAAKVFERVLDTLQGRS